MHYSWLLLHELLSLSPAPHPHVRPPRSPPSFSAQRQMFPGTPGHGVCVCVYICTYLLSMVVVVVVGGGLEVVPNDT